MNESYPFSGDDGKNGNIFNEPEVATKLANLRNKGAVNVDPMFSVAGDDQGDVILNDHRYLVMEHDEDYERYKEIMETAGLPYVKNDTSVGGDDRVVVGEIDLDAVALPLIIPSVQPKSGVTTKDAFKLAGEAVNRIIQTSGSTPTAASLKLEKLMLLRDDDVHHTPAGVMLVPDVEFEPVTDESKAALVARIEQLLSERYSKFGATALVAAFREGLGNGDSSRSAE